MKIILERNQVPWNRKSLVQWHEWESGPGGESLFRVSLSGRGWIILVKPDVEIRGRLKGPAAD